MPSNTPSGCLPAVLRLFGVSSKQPTSRELLPYRRKDHLLTQAERAFFSVLQQAVEQNYLIFAKVRLIDLVWLTKGTQSRQSHINRVQSKHVDFVLCSHDTIRPLVAIELDDASHAAEPRQSRDTFLDQALRAAGLPLLRVPCKANYSAKDVAQQIRIALTPSSSTPISDDQRSSAR